MIKHKPSDEEERQQNFTPIDIEKAKVKKRKKDAVSIVEQALSLRRLYQIERDKQSVIANELREKLLELIEQVLPNITQVEETSDMSRVDTIVLLSTLQVELLRDEVMEKGTQDLSGQTDYYTTFLHMQSLHYGSKEQAVRIELASIKGDPALTPDYLQQQVLPYLHAIEAVQKIINDLTQRNSTLVEIFEISHHSPLTVSVAGLLDGIGTVKEDIIPWRAKHAKRMADFEETEKRLMINQSRLQQLTLKADLAKSQAEQEKLRAEAVKLLAEMEQVKLDNERKRLELKQLRIQLGLDILMKIAPDLKDTERIEYLIHLLPHLNVLIDSELEIVSVETIEPGQNLG